MDIPNRQPMNGPCYQVGGGSLPFSSVPKKSASCQNEGSYANRIGLGSFSFLFLPFYSRGRGAVANVGKAGRRRADGAGDAPIPDSA